MKFLIKKIKYLFDSALEKSLLNLFIFLILTSLSIILIFSITTFVIYKLGISISIGETYQEFLWQTFRFFLSSGTILSTGAINPIDFILKIIITIIGIGLFYTLIGIITSRVSLRAHQLREGSSEVQEKNRPYLRRRLRTGRRRLFQQSRRRNPPLRPVPLFHACAVLRRRASPRMARGV